MREGCPAAPPTWRRTFACLAAPGNATAVSNSSGSREPPAATMFAVPSTAIVRPGGSGASAPTHPDLAGQLRQEARAEAVPPADSGVRMVGGLQQQGPVAVSDHVQYIAQQAGAPKEQAASIWARCGVEQSIFKTELVWRDLR
jgi:hypothetical protein